MSDPQLFVPVHETACALSLCLFRTAAGKKTAVAFTSPLRVAKVLGTEQKWAQISERTLRGLISDLDVTGIVIDPAGMMTRPVRAA
jgi:hypothetical protein